MRLVLLLKKKNDSCKELEKTINPGGSFRLTFIQGVIEFGLRHTRIRQLDSEYEAKTCDSGRAFEGDNLRSQRRRDFDWPRIFQQALDCGSRPLASPLFNQTRRRRV